MNSGRFRPCFPRWIVAVRVVTALGVVGCNTRDRLTFPTPGPPGSGPQTIIDRPSGDTTVDAGPGFEAAGYTRDSNGVDTVYFETEGGVTSFPPLVGGGDSVRYVLPLTTNGQEGQMITLRIFGTDVFGVRGDTAIRHITVQ